MKDEVTRDTDPKNLKKKTERGHSSNRWPRAPRRQVSACPTEHYIQGKTRRPWLWCHGRKRKIMTTKRGQCSPKPSSLATSLIKRRKSSQPPRTCDLEEEPAAVVTLRRQSQNSDSRDSPGDRLEVWLLALPSLSTVFDSQNSINWMWLCIPIKSSGEQRE